MWKSTFWQSISSEIIAWNPLWVSLMRIWNCSNMKLCHTKKHFYTLEPMFFWGVIFWCNINWGTSLEKKTFIDNKFLKKIPNYEMMMKLLPQIKSYVEKWRNFLTNFFLEIFGKFFSKKNIQQDEIFCHNSWMFDWGCHHFKTKLAHLKMRNFIKP